MSPPFEGALATPTWHEQAACASELPDLFHPFTGDPAATTAALEVCARCPVLDACRTYALNAREQHGIWGGLTEKQRESITRRAAKAGVPPTQVPVEVRRGPRPGASPRPSRATTPTAEIVTRYEAGESIRAIATSISLAVSTVRRRLVRAEVTMRPQGVRYSSPSAAGGGVTP